MQHNVQQIPDRCVLHHKVFTLGEVRFRRSLQDGTPVMAVYLGEREASIPLKSLRREFKIGDTSHDGLMLDLVGTSLDFVSIIQPGDPFPPELRTGEASWQPNANHLRLATTRLRLGLVTWLSPQGPWAKMNKDVQTLLRLAGDAELHEAVQSAASAGAEQLGLGGAHEVLQVMEDLSQELSFIEALRDRLMARVERLCDRFMRLRAGRKLAGQHAETLSLVERLGMLAARQIRDRFDEVDSQTGEIAALLRNAETQRHFIRSNRDWLYRSQRAWQPLLDQWEHVSEEVTAEAAQLLSSTYQFLAPRFMPTKEWLVQRGPRRRERAAAHVKW